MYRIDRILGEARLVRLRRAARRQAMKDRKVRTSPVDTREWFAEQQVAMRIIADLARGGDEGVRQDGDVDARRTHRADVIDLNALGPLIDSVQKAVLGVIGETEPQGRLLDLWYPAISQAVSDKIDPAVRGKDEGARARRLAVEDFCELAVEFAMFEAVARICRQADLLRPVSERADPDDIVVEGEGIHRPSAREKDRRKSSDARAAKAREAQQERRRKREAVGVVGLPPAPEPVEEEDVS